MNEEKPPSMDSNGLNGHSIGKFLNALSCLGGHTLRQRGFYNLLDLHRDSNDNQRCQSGTFVVRGLDDIE